MLYLYYTLEVLSKFQNDFHYINPALVKFLKYSKFLVGNMFLLLLPTFLTQWVSNTRCDAVVGQFFVFFFISLLIAYKTILYGEAIALSEMFAEILIAYQNIS